MEIKKTGNVWVVFANTDLNEGRGVQAPTYCCKLEATALRKAKGQDVQGNDAIVIECPLFQVSHGDQGFLRYGPVYLVPPTVVDEEEQKEKTKEKEREIKRIEVVKKAKELGLTDEELKLL